MPAVVPDADAVGESDPAGDGPAVEPSTPSALVSESFDEPVVAVQTQIEAPDHGLWIDIHARDTRGEPAKGRAFRLQTASQTVATGQLDELGHVRLSGDAVHGLHLQDLQLTLLPSGSPACQSVGLHPWVGLELVDARGEAAAHWNFTLEGSGLTQPVNGRLNADGARAVLLPDGVDPADLRVSFTPPSPLLADVSARPEHWVELELRDGRGEPASGWTWTIEGPSLATPLVGSLDGRGHALVALPDALQECTVRFDPRQLRLVNTLEPRGTRWVELELLDTRGAPAARWRWSLALGDQQLAGALDERGRALVSLTDSVGDDPPQVQFFPPRP